MKKHLLMLFACMYMVGQQASAQELRAGQEESDVVLLEKNHEPEEGAVIIDGRPEEVFKRSHLPGAINVMEAKFGEFLTKILEPEQEYYLVADTPERLSVLMEYADTIGYIPNLKGVFIYDAQDGEQMERFDQEEFDEHRDAFTIVDIRSDKEFAENPLFEDAINIPLEELEQRKSEIPTDKPVVVHCATGYRSAIGSSILHRELPEAKVLDMGGHVKDYRDQDQ